MSWCIGEDLHSLSSEIPAQNININYPLPAHWNWKPILKLGGFCIYHRCVSILAFTQVKFDAIETTRFVFVKEHFKGLPHNDFKMLVRSDKSYLFNLICLQMVQSNDNAIMQ